MENNDSSVSLRGSPRKSVAGKRLSGDADRAVRPANQMPTELMQQLDYRISEARRCKRIAERDAAKLAVWYWDGNLVALVNLRAWLKSKPRQASGGANAAGELPLARANKKGTNE